MSFSPAYRSAIEDFHRMRRRAGVRKIFDVFRHQENLLSYKEVRHQLHAIERSGVELNSIPINAIQGSVGRYADFTKDFLPTKNVDRQRWARVKAQFLSLEGVPPIDVYQLGEVYFVADGNHRVSVAKEMGISTIDAYVRTVSAKVPLNLDENMDDFLIKAELAEFLDLTQFDQIYPDIDLKVTTPGRYTIILQQIEALHFANELEAGKSLDIKESIKTWYDSIYYPIVDVIREQDILKEYPNRTETDLFLWIFKHQAALVDSLGWEVPPQVSVKDLAHKPSRFQLIYNQAKLLFQKSIRWPERDSGPPPGTWRQEKMAAPEGRLFGSIIVVIDGSVKGWGTVDYGRIASSYEGSQLLGLHISKSDKSLSDEIARDVQAEFDQRCETCKTRGQLAFAFGPPEKIISERAKWADLVIVSKPGNFNKKIQSIQSIVQSCPTPILITNGTKSKFETVLLVYDGNPKSEEALFLAAYLATFWELSLFVITLQNKKDHSSSQPTLHAKEFIDFYGVAAKFINLSDEPGSSILTTINEQNIDLIVIGGYNYTTKIRSGNQILNQLLDKSQQPILICR